MAITTAAAHFRSELARSASDQIMTILAIFLSLSKFKRDAFPFLLRRRIFFEITRVVASLPKLIAGKGIIIFRRKIPFLDTSRVDRINRITMRVELTTIGHELRIVPCPQEDFQIVQARRSILCSRHDFVEKKT